MAFQRHIFRNPAVLPVHSPSENAKDLSSGDCKTRRGLYQRGVRQRLRGKQTLERELVPWDLVQTA
jgi:hypothetical protein